MTPRRTLLTGAGGFCGRAIAAALCARGDDVVATIRPGSSAAVQLPRGVEVVECELADPAALRALVSRVRPSRCVHAAAAGARARCDDIDLLLATNVRATAALAEALADVGAARLVTLGSSSEYGSPAGAMTEAAAARPDDLYGVSKLAAGLAAHAIGRARGLETVHLRLFSVYGPGEAPARLIASLVRALAARQPVPLTTGHQVRDFVYVADAADAVLRALSAPVEGGSTFNVGSGRETSVREIALLACRVAGVDESLLRFGALPARGDERRSWCANTREAADVLGWRARTPLAEGLRRTFAALGDELAMAA
ncbi:MAG TPA: NAD(P)-dependent oxidoreductase [Gaiellales bacterium]